MKGIKYMSRETISDMRFFQTVGAIACLPLCIIVAAASVNSSAPLTYGIVLFRMFDLLDVFGPVEVLQFLSHAYKTEIVFIAETMKPVTTRPSMAAMNPLNNNTAPKLDVLIIPGGPGWRNPAWHATLDYIRHTAPKVKQVLTICTGAGLAAKSGIMAGRKATTNKSSWPAVVEAGPNTTWVPKARWVEDYSSSPPVWSSSGVTAGLDMMLHWVEKVYNKQNATNIAKYMEHVRIRDPSNDPFARK